MNSCTDRGVGVVIGGPYNSGILARGPFPGAKWNYQPAPDWILEKAGKLKAVVEAHGVRLVDAALQFPLLHPAVLSVIPGGQTAEEMEGNFSAAATLIPQVLWDDLRQQRLIDPAVPLNPPHKA